MAQTVRDYTSDGIQVLYPVNFDLGYIERSHVYVYTGEIGDFETQLDYTWMNSSQIQLTTPVLAGNKVWIRRIVPRNVLMNDYENGAILQQQNLDDSYKQALMILEEYQDGFSLLYGDPIIPTPNENPVLTMRRFDFLADATQVDLTDAQAVVTVGGLTLEDAKGGLFAATTDVNQAKAGTIEIGSGTMFDLNGKKFKHVGKDIWLETLGLDYTETPLDVASRIADLRVGGFIPKISESYDLSVPSFGEHDYADDWVTSLHRGLATPNVQNTILAFTSATKATPRGNRVFWETDCQISDDDVPFLFHDKDVDTLTNGTGEAKLKTIAELKALKYKKAIGTIFEESCRIDTLEDFIKEAAAVGAQIEIEVKRYGGQLPISKYKLVTDLVKKYKMINRTTYSSFYIEDLQLIRELEPYGAIALATSVIPLNTTELDTLRKLAAGSGRKATILMSLSQWYANPEQVTIAHAYDCDCMAYTANKGRELYDLASLGIHRLHTDSTLR